MLEKTKKLFLSTALPYVNSNPHLGFALELVQADAIARYHRLLDEDVFFLAGTDENSLKNVRAAEEEGIPVKELVDRNAKRFYDLKQALNLSFDDFIRTTEKRHIEGAQKLWLACEKDIYKKKYRGLYCVGCEAFYKEGELEGGLCPEHRIRPESVEEENYFFKLSKYQHQLQDIIQQGRIKIIPETRKNEVLSFISQGLEDICISRSNERAHNWGIDVPGDPSQKQWCWIEALSNYITALGYAENSKKFQEFWQKNENKIHIIGKGISRFHCVYWIALLLSAKLSLPKTIFVHGYVTSGGEKMSKSLGNIVCPFELVKKYGVDPVRYFLLREFSPTEDGDFTYQKFEERYNADLASGLGNLVARVLTLADRFKIRRSLKVETTGKIVQKAVIETQKNYKKALDGFKFNEALGMIWELIGFCDKYIDKEKPWENRDNSKEVISDLLVALAEIAEMLKPSLPQTSEEIFEQLRKGKGEPLFPKLYPKS